MLLWTDVDITSSSSSLITITSLPPSLSPEQSMVQVKMLVALQDLWLFCAFLTPLLMCSTCLFHNIGGSQWGYFLMIDWGFTFGISTPPSYFSTQRPPPPQSSDHHDNSYLRILFTQSCIYLLCLWMWQISIKNIVWHAVLSLNVLTVGWAI